MRIAPELLAKIKGAVNIVEIVGEHVVLRKSGSNFSGLCPFHSERTPSFSVSEEKQLFYCYGCKEGGDVVEFVSQLYGIGFIEAVRELADRGRVPLPSQATRGGEKESERERALREKTQTGLKLNRFAAAFFRQNLARQEHVAAYFRSRGLSQETLKNFYCGAAPAGWDALATHLIEKKAPVDLACELGLIRPSKKNTPGGCGYFDLFRSRAMFPIIDQRGKVVAFGGRTVPPPEGAPETNGDSPSEASFARGASPKYLNSSESWIFHKSRVLYGLYQAQKHIREEDQVIIVEGYFDVMALAAAGFGNVVATCGTSLTADHLKILQRLASKIVLLFDGDEAGINATTRSMELGLEQGLILHGAFLPGGKDPDEILVGDTGREKMAGILSSAEPLLDRKMRELALDAGQGAEAKTRALKQVGTWLARYRDPVGVDVQIQSAEKLFSVSRSLIFKAMGQKAPPSSSRPQPRLQAQNRPASRPSRSSGKVNPNERLVLRALLSSRSEISRILDEIRGNLPPELTFLDLIEEPASRELARSVLEARSAGKSAAQAWEALHLSQAISTDRQIQHQIQQMIAELALTDHNPEGLDENSVKLAAGRQIKRLLVRISQRIKEAAAAAELNKDRQLHAKLMKEYLDVQRRMKEFNRFYEEA